MQVQERLLLERAEDEKKKMKDRFDSEYESM
jgi:hypothetical protein